MSVFPSSRRVAAAVVAVAASAVLTAAAAGALLPGSPASDEAVPLAVRVPVPTAQVLGAEAPGADVPWSQPLRVTADDGRLVDVEATDPDGHPLRGAVGIDGAWASLSTLIPLADYRLTAVVRDGAGADHRLPLTARTTPAQAVLHAGLVPGDDAVVGIGMPVTVRLDRPVSDPAARAAVEQRLSVTSTPAVVGAWRWLSDTQLHYRPEEFWQPGTKVHVVSDLHRLALPDGTWGSGVRTSRFTIGDALVSTVDVAAHTMTVTRGGKVLRVMRASMGKPEFPTRGGTFLVLEKDASRIMNSDTVGLPGEYRTKVDWAVRLTYSGTFTHSAPWSVKDQGVRNVSHGCINLSPADAKWFYDQAGRGDVVKVVNAAVGPNLDDPGSADWNLSFDQWRA